MNIHEVVALLAEKGIAHKELDLPLEHNRQIIISGTCDLIENEYEDGWDYSIRGHVPPLYAWTDVRGIKTVEELSAALDKHHVRHD